MRGRTIWVGAALCAACVAGAACGSESAPAPPESTAKGDGNTTIDTGSKPEDPSGKGSGGASTAGPSAGSSAGSGDGSSGQGAGLPTHGGDIDCHKLFDGIRAFGCSLARLVCAAVESVHVGGTSIDCGAVVDVACGTLTIAAAAAEGLCTLADD
jgi:hypothetical protein